MALVSPGLEITVTDDSAYLPTSIGTVPLVIIATEENKKFNNILGSGTLKNVAGKLQAVTSQRELITSFGYPTFRQTAAGTPIHGHELNEYGLMAAYSALGVSNRSFVVRADIDTTQLIGSAGRPVKDPANGTYWLDTTETTWGIYEWNATTQSFTNKVPELITSLDDTVLVGIVSYPKESIGLIGTYAIVMTDVENHLFYKRTDNAWVRVGSIDWQRAHPTVSGTVSSPTFTIGDKISINTTEVILTGSTVASVVNDILAAAITGVTASMRNGRLFLYAIATSASNGTVADGKIAIANVLGTPLTTAGITADTYNSVIEVVNSYVNIPDWESFSDNARPTGSVWIKTGAIGNGANVVMKQYVSDTDTWVTKATPMFRNAESAIASMDPAGGGAGIVAGSLFLKTGYTLRGLEYLPMIRTVQGKTSVTSDVIQTGTVLVSGNTFSLGYTKFGESTLTYTTVPISGTAVTNLVTSILSAGIPEVSASYNATAKTITITHNYGGVVALKDLTGTPLNTVGITTSSLGVYYNVQTGEMMVNGFAEFSFTVSQSRPYTAPADGTLWYFNNPLEVDIMVNGVGGWKGYNTVSLDARGYNLVGTDPNGVIMSAGAPVTQSDGTALVAGDLWLDTLDLEHFPKLARYSLAGKWVPIDNADRFTQNGIVFADARWDTTGTVDPIGSPKVLTTDLLASNYVDLDCPDYRLYPRGTLLFNTRRSGFNVKRYVVDYFSDEAFPDAFDNNTLPTEKGTWLTASGLNNNGAMNAGHHAQRAMVIKALKAAVDGNDQIREEAFQFNLIACPGYPELIPNMVALNNDRKNTAFVIGDTPLFLKPNIIDLTNWSENTNGDGMSTADPYLGIYYPSALTNDLQGNTIVMPPSHVMLRTMIRNDNVSYMWFAPAGMRRGLIDNASDIGVVDVATGAFQRNGINHGLRDALYTMRINPLTILPNIGLVVWGQKTRNPFASAMDRVNVARLVNYIRLVLGHAGDAFLFEPNDAQTRKEFKAIVGSVFNDLIAKRGIYDFLVICDESNNTSDRIARNELYCDVAIEPMKAVEFIYIPIRLKNPGAIKLM